MQPFELKENCTLSFASCLNEFSKLLNNSIVTDISGQKLPLDLGLNEIVLTLKKCRENKGAVYIVGNGGSAAIASHVVIDLLNRASMKAMAMLDSATVTCISNDYGYEQVYAKQISQFAVEKDTLIAISSSGNSKNILNAVNAARSCHAQVITFSGFSEHNALRGVGDFNLWLNAKDYGQVEIGHAFVLHHLTDQLCLK